MFVVRDVAVAYLSGMWLLIPWMIFINGKWSVILYAVMINALFALGMIPDIRQIIETRKKPEYQNTDNDTRMRNAMEIMPMGRGMMKMMNAVRFGKKNAPKSGHPTGAESKNG
jgi:hypothetical protein